jgi:hypothetical protein
MKVGDLVNHNPSCFDEPWTSGIVIETRSDIFEYSIEGPQKLTQHKVFWSVHTCCWIEEGLLEVANESR